MNATPGSSTRSGSGSAGSTPGVTASSHPVSPPALPHAQPAQPTRPADPPRQESPGVDPDLTRFSVRVGDGYTAEDLARVEWLIADGNGGFAMGTAAGIPQRRYHSWMVTARTPPVGRVSLLHAVADRLIIDGGVGDETPAESHDLCSFRFPGVTHPRGLDHLVAFERSESAAWTYRVQTRAGPCVNIRRELSVIAPGVVAIRYAIESEPREVVPPPLAKGVRIEVRPLLALRDFHDLTRRPAEPWDQVAVSTSDGVVRIRHGPPGHGSSGHVPVTTGGVPDLSMTVRAGSSRWMFGGPSQWWRDFEYPLDRARGQDFREDLYSPGVFTVEAQVGGSFEVWAWVGQTPDFDARVCAGRR
ncbi:MAG: glycogen debranching enzyme N-terminal domain-containing protein, partial [Phycisphaerae bacterium]|nr:glycogen debranching enzyme N-terminal domain-containing protein [Phycisphaerae bacterium]